MEPKRELTVALKLFGSFAIILGAAIGLFAVVDHWRAGMDAALPLLSLGVQLFVAGLLLLAASAGLEILGAIRDGLAADAVETRRYVRTRSAKGSLLAAKLVAEPSAS